MHPESSEFSQLEEKEKRKVSRDEAIFAIESIDNRKARRLRDAEQEPKEGGWKDRKTRILMAELANAGDELIEFYRLSEKYGWLVLYEAEVVVGRKQPKSSEAKEKIFQARTLQDKLFLKRERHGELKRKWQWFGDEALTPEEDRELDELDKETRELQEKYDRLVEEALELEHNVWVEKNLENPELQMVVEEMESSYAAECRAAKKRLKELQVMGMGPEVMTSPGYAEFLGEEYEKAINQAQQAEKKYKDMQAKIIKDFGRESYEAVKKSLRRL
jgi:hypothetical protein